MFGQMVDDIKDNGKIIKCMEKEISIGQMGNNIAVYILFYLFR